MHFNMQLVLANFKASTTPIFKQHQIYFMAYRALMDPAVATHPFIQLNVLLYNSN